MANRPKGYGMTGELAEKRESKYDKGMEQQARYWLETLVKEPWPCDDFHEALKNGIYLCKAINVLQPGSVRKIAESKMAFKMMENIGNFLDAAGKFGVQKSDLFQTVDLFEAANMGQVVTAIHALGRVTQKKGLPFPSLDPKKPARMPASLIQKCRSNKASL